MIFVNINRDQFVEHHHIAVLLIFCILTFNIATDNCYA